MDVLQSVIEVDCLAALSRANSPDFCRSTKQDRPVQRQSKVSVAFHKAWVMLFVRTSLPLARMPRTVQVVESEDVWRDRAVRVPPRLESKILQRSQIFGLLSVASRTWLRTWAGGLALRVAETEEEPSRFQQAFCLGLRGETGARLCRLRIAVVNSLRPCIACRAKVLPRSAQLLKEVASRAPDLPVEDVSDGQ